MWSIITAFAVFIYHTVCEYVLFLVVDLIFKGPLDNATSDKDLGVLWALEGSVLLLSSLLTAVVSHRPLLLSLLTALTFLYSLLKYDDSLKELLTLTLRLLRWADARFFLLRCLARRQWRRWRSVEAAGPPGESTPLSRTGRRLRACAEPVPLLGDVRTPRIGPAQLFSASGLLQTEPQSRRGVSRLAAPVGRLRIDDDDDEEEGGGWRRTAVAAVKAAGHALAVVAVRAAAWAAGRARATLGVGADSLSVVVPPRGLRHAGGGPVNALLQATANCPLLHTTLNRLRPAFGCSVDQEALFSAILPAINALAADVEAAATGGTVDAREVNSAAAAVLGARDSAAEAAEVLMMQLHVACQDIDRFPRLRGQLEGREVRAGLKDETVCREQLDAAYRDLLHLLPPLSLGASVASGSPHRRHVNRIADLAFLASKWRAGHSELRQLLETQTLDVGVCASCGRLCVAATTVTLLRLPAAPSPAARALHLSELTRRALAEAGGVCTALRCPCGAAETAPAPGLLSPIAAATPGRPPNTPGSTAAAHTSTPVPARRCRADGNCCRRFLHHPPPVLLLRLPPGANCLPPTDLELGPGVLLPGDAGCRYTVVSVVTEDGACSVRRDGRWFRCDDEVVGCVETAWCPPECARLMVLEQQGQ